MSTRSAAAGTRRLASHFESLEKQAHAARFGMWIFLATEVLLFTGLFVAYAAYRFLFSAEFAAASHHLKTWIGTTNTFVLLTSSFTVAMSIHAARRGRSRLAAGLLAASVLLGLVFLGFKALEYHADFEEGLLPGRFLSVPELRSSGAAVFMSLYWLMTGLHAVHVTVGMGVLSVMAWLAWKGTFGPHYDTPLELGGMYWHLVDVIWIFLWPLLYLVG
ncbi:MAG: cytochrome c oxidase subunit 3 family protein [Deltaproteobacteria bacterium]|nr:cytochrome c oxidase subunit 3 family protein [Deltaproteobacteria bacterium]